MNLLIRKSWIAGIHDITMAAISFLFALYLRLGEKFDYNDPNVISGLAIFTSVCAVVFFAFRIYRRSWRYTSLQDVSALVKAVTVAILIFLPLMFLFNRLEGMPRSLMFINWFVLVSLLAGPRFFYRSIKERKFFIDTGPIPESQKISVLLVGLNDHTEMFLRETVGNRHSNYRVVGIIDDDKAKDGQYIRNVKIYGNTYNLAKIITKLTKKGKAPQKIIIPPDTIDGDVVMNLLSVAEEFGLTMGRLPRLTDFKQTEEQTLELRPIALEDLLGRPQNTLDKSSMEALVKDKRIIVTGAGGTIGSELVRQIAGYKPAHICLFENSEHNLYLIDKELNTKYPELSKTPVIGDVRDKDYLTTVFKKERPHLVFHAAALKHVPMSEVNISEAILTNIVGTKNVADVSLETGVEEMVMISTDKAVNPTNVMGATKRVAESYIQALGESKAAKNTKLVTVRFGNVLGSTGSVIPLFKQQLQEGGPITITHPDVTRYFMTVREAVELVLQASSLVVYKKTEGSKIFVLDMGEPVRIKDLAEQLIRLAGLKPDEDIKIEYTELRAGEKLYEELFHESEAPTKTDFESIMLANPRDINLSSLNKLLKKIHSTALKRDDEKSLDTLKKIVPEYGEELEKLAA